MGLDQFAYYTKRDIKDIVDTYDKIDIEFKYWRKHPNIHGWMENLFAEKGGSGTFNCIGVKLTSEDLDRLEKDIREGKLPSTTGFFFGYSDGSEKKDDLNFIKKAREKLSEGNFVYYTSWW